REHYVQANRLEKALSRLPALSTRHRAMVQEDQGPDVLLRHRFERGPGEVPGATRRPPGGPYTRPTPRRSDPPRPGQPLSLVEEVPSRLRRTLAANVERLLLLVRTASRPARQDAARC